MIIHFGYGRTQPVVGEKALARCGNRFFYNGPTPRPGLDDRRRRQICPSCRTGDELDVTLNRRRAQWPFEVVQKRKRREKTPDPLPEFSPPPLH